MKKENLTRYNNDDIRYRLLVKEEIWLWRERGCDVSGFERKLDDRKDPMTREACLEFFEEMKTLTSPHDADEPSDYWGIAGKRPDGPRKIKRNFGRAALFDKMLGAWQGRVAGCLLGKPVEGWDIADIELLGNLTTGYPLRDYLGAIDPPPVDQINPRFRRLLVERFGSENSGVVKDSIAGGAPWDDDTNYTVLNTRILESRGFLFTTEDVGDAWLNTLPYGAVCTAETIAYMNLINRIPPPECGRFLNPRRELIGAQIRADAFGYACPGMPEMAAALAFKDAALSHTRNGIYGEMFVAAMTAMAFVSDDVEEIIDVGLSEIPRNSRLTLAVKDIVATWKKSRDWRATMGELEERYGKQILHEGHAINNACVVVIGLLEGAEEFERGMTVAVMCGYDADCNGATAGSILGVKHGAAMIPEKWMAPLNDTLFTTITDEPAVKISGMAERSLALARAALNGDLTIEDLARNELREYVHAKYPYVPYEFAPLR